MAHPGPSAARRWLVALFKLGLTGTLLALTLRRVPLEEVGQSLAGYGWTEALGLVLLTLVSTALAAVRWRRVLRHAGQRARFGELFGDLLVGSTYNLLLPTSIGGDVIRAYRCAERLEVKALGWATVGFDRLLGLLGLTALASGTMMATAAHWPLSLVVVGAAATSALLLGLVFAPKLIHLSRTTLGRLTRAGDGFLGALGQAFSGPLASPGVRVETFAWSVLGHLVTLALLLPACWSWREPVALAIFVGVPVVILLSSLPVTISGLGLREALFVEVLSRMGVTPAHALSLATYWLVATLLLGLLGLAWLATERLASGQWSRFGSARSRTAL